MKDDKLLDDDIMHLIKKIASWKVYDGCGACRRDHERLLGYLIELKERRRTDRERKASKKKRYKFG